MLDDKQLGYDLVGAGFEVYHSLGGGLSEEIYQQSLELELKSRAISFDAKRELSVYYKDIKLQKTYIPDLLIGDQIIAELKSVKKLLPEHQAQLFNYMRITNINVGYLLNFGPIDQMEWQRIKL